MSQNPPESAAARADLGREVVVQRVLNAPRALVFKVWTEASHLVRWWGPDGFTTPRCEADARPGGAIRIDMRGPDGTVYPMTGIFQEVLPPERLVFTVTPLDAEGNEFGQEQLKEVLQTAGQQSVDFLVKTIVDRVQSFSSGHPQNDDITLAAVQRSE